MHAHACVHTYSWTLTRIHTNKWTLTHKHALTNTRRYTYSCRCTLADAVTLMHMHLRTHTHKHMQTHTQRRANEHTHTHVLTQMRWWITYALMHLYSLAHTHTNTHTQTHKSPLTRTHATSPAQSIAQDDFSHPLSVLWMICTSIGGRPTPYIYIIEEDWEYKVAQRALLLVNQPVYSCAQPMGPAGPVWLTNRTPLGHKRTTLPFSLWFFICLYN